MSRSAQDRIRDIRDAVEAIRTFERTGRDEAMVFDAVRMRLLEIGEAVTPQQELNIYGVKRGKVSIQKSSRGDEYSLTKGKVGLSTTSTIEGLDIDSSEHDVDLQLILIREIKTQNEKDHAKEMAEAMLKAVRLPGMPVDG